MIRTFKMKGKVMAFNYYKVRLFSYCVLNNIKVKVVGKMNLSEIPFWQRYSLISILKILRMI